VLSDHDYTTPNSTVSVKSSQIPETASKLILLSVWEQLLRGQVYFDNRLFPQFREYSYKIIENFPTDPAMAGALFMTGRSYYWERAYDKAIPWLERVASTREKLGRFAPMAEAAGVILGR